MVPCPHCGELLKEDAVSCRECGSDMETGWNPDVDYYSVEIPDHLPEDFGEEGSIRPLIYKVAGAISGLLAFLALGLFRANPILALFGTLILLVVSVRCFSLSQPAWKSDFPRR